jgi:exosome complex component RRP42
MVELSIVDKLKRSKILDLLQEGKRIDGRGLDEVRPLSIDTGVVPNANGSARARLGDTEIVCGVKIQPDKPFPDMGDKGIFICTAEILPLAHPSAETGPPTPDVIELARVVDRGIRESGMIDLSQMVLEEDKSVIGLFADNVVTDHDGNLFDACSYASVAAVMTSKIPKWEMKNDKPAIVDGETLDAPITTIPISITMGRIGEFIMIDPNLDEWGCMDARITITTNSDGNIVALQKGGSAGFTFEQLVKCSELSISTGSKIREIIKQATEVNQ